MSYGRDAGDNYTEQQAVGEHCSESVGKVQMWYRLHQAYQTRQEGVYFLFRIVKWWMWEKKVYRSTIFSYLHCINDTSYWPKGKLVLYFQQSQIWQKQFDSEDYFLFSVLLISSISVLISKYQACFMLLIANGGLRNNFAKKADSKVKLEIILNGCSLYKWKENP